MEHVLNVSSGQFLDLNPQETDLLFKIYERQRKGWRGGFLSTPLFAREGDPTDRLAEMIRRASELKIAYHVSPDFTFTVCHLMFDGNLYCGVAKRCNYSGKMMDEPKPELGRALAFRRALLSMPIQLAIPVEVAYGYATLS